MKQAVFVSDWKILHSLCYWHVVPMICWKWAKLVMKTMFCGYLV